MKIIPNPGDRHRRYAAILEAAGWVCHEPGQSCVGVNHVFPGKQDTSFAASVYVKPRTGTQRELVWRHLQQVGPRTDVELQDELGLVPNSERPRRVELVEGGFVADSGVRKKHHGEDHIVWMAT
jgi:hypothetical protein